MFWRKKTPPLTKTILAEADLCGQKFYVNFVLGGEYRTYSWSNCVNFVNDDERFQMIRLSNGEWRVCETAGLPKAETLVAATKWCLENYR